MNKEYSCEVYSNEYFIQCAKGGALTCGLTHTLLTPIDVVKCRLQACPFSKYFIHGPIGWLPTLFGYSLQGAATYSGYEYFKHKFTEMVSPETAYEHRTSLYLAAAACSEIAAGFLLAPFEAAKVRMQTAPSEYRSKLRSIMFYMCRIDGLGSFYRGLLPLWGRQVPYAMMKYATFESILEYVYKNFVKKPRQECSNEEQMMATFAAGYMTGVLCAIVSHPADTIVTKVNRNPKTTVGCVICELGYRGLWRGFKPRIFMVGTLIGTQWYLYNAFREHNRMPTPSPP